MLALGPVDLDLDGIGARRADEARKRVRDQKNVRVDMDDVPHVGGDEAVKRPRRPSSRQRREPVGDRREEDGDAPQDEPEEVHQKKQEAEEDRQARAAQVVIDIQAHRPRLLRDIGGRLPGVRVRITVRQEEQVAPGLGRVAKPVSKEITHSVRRAPARQARKPDEDREHEETRHEGGAGLPRAGARALIVVARAVAPAARRADEGSRDDRGRDDEHDAEERLPAVLPLGWVDLDVDGIPRLAREARVRISGEEEVRVEMRREANVRGEEVVQADRRAPLDECQEPVDDRDEEDANRPDDEPDPERDREQESEGHGQPRAVKVVRDDDPDRVPVRIRRLFGRFRRFRRFDGRRLEDHRPALMPEQLTAPGPVSYPLRT